MKNWAAEKAKPNGKMAEKKIEKWDLPAKLAGFLFFHIPLVERVELVSLSISRRETAIFLLVPMPISHMLSIFTFVKYERGNEK